MSSIKLKGSTSGDITISAPAVAGTNTLTLPAETGTVLTTNNFDLNGQELILDADGDTSITADTDDQIDIKIGGTDKIQIDSSGNLLIGKTSVDYTTVGFEATPTSSFQSHAMTADGKKALLLSRKTSDGSIVEFRKNTTVIGSIGVSTTSAKIYMGGGNTGITFTSNGRGHPTDESGVGADNSRDWGQSNYRWDDIYATNGTIQTSDRNEKQSIESLTTDEMNVAKRLSSLFKTFKFNSSVEEKGDNARTHTGIIAQDVQQAFTDEGLDASNYALFISSTWYENNDGEEVDSETEGAIQKTRLGIRYPELLSFIQAYNDQRFTELEARITALENN